mmetsp:Transcript_25491/g.57932  ORF Transcript_25491/g.57932 Transcript_25491/m.57932 type:complete len:91 (-) Transcript_25491:42-314(-)
MTPNDSPESMLSLSLRAFLMALLALDVATETALDGAPLSSLSSLSSSLGPSPCRLSPKVVLDKEVFGGPVHTTPQISLGASLKRVALKEP